MDRETEVRLARQACLGDTKAFEELEKDCLPGLRRYTLGLYKGNHAKAEDNVSETRARAWNSICHFQGNASFCTWMRTISRNVFLDENRHEQRHPTSSLDAPFSGDSDSQSQGDLQVDDAPSPEELATEERFCAALKQCFSKLSGRDQEIFRLYGCDGYTYREIGGKLGLGTTGAHYAMFRIFRLLRSCMTEKRWDSPERIREGCLCKADETSEVMQ